MEGEWKGGSEGGYYKLREEEREEGREGRKVVWRVRRREGVRECITNGKERGI